MAIAESVSTAKMCLTVICSYCGRLLKGKRVWEKKHLSLEERGRLPVSHGICLNCLAEQFPNEFLALEREGSIQTSGKSDIILQ